MKYQVACIVTPETYPESCETYKLERFAKIVNSF